MDKDVEYQRIASRQHGAVGSGQLRAAGLSTRAVTRRRRAGMLTPLRPGVAGVAGASPSWEQAVVAMLLAAGHGAVASHATAVRLWDLAVPHGRFDRHALELTTTLHEQHRLRGVRAHRTGVFLDAEHTSIRGIPVTTPERTIVDCSARLTVAEIGRMTDDGIRRRIVQLERLRTCVGGLRAAPGRHPAKVRAVLALRLPGYDAGESGLQMRFVRALVRDGCPEPVLEHPVTVGGRRYRIDLAYPDVRLAIEVDGYEVHNTRGAFDHDRARGNDLVAAGWTLLRFTSVMSDSDAAAQVRAMFVRLGAA